MDFISKWNQFLFLSHSKQGIKVVEESGMAIIVFSQKYAFSAFCLDEFDATLESTKSGRLVWPVFYKVDSEDVQYQTGSCEKAFDNHDKNLGINKVQKWRSTLAKAACLSGCSFKEGYLTILWATVLIHYTLKLIK